MFKFIYSLLVVIVSFFFCLFIVVVFEVRVYLLHCRPFASCFTIALWPFAIVVFRVVDYYEFMTSQFLCGFLAFTNTEGKKTKKEKLDESAVW